MAIHSIDDSVLCTCKIARTLILRGQSCYRCVFLLEGKYIPPWSAQMFLHLKWSETSVRALPFSQINCGVFTHNIDLLIIRFIYPVQSVLVPVDYVILCSVRAEGIHNLSLDTGDVGVEGSP